MTNLPVWAHFRNVSLGYGHTCNPCDIRSRPRDTSARMLCDTFHRKSFRRLFRRKFCTAKKDLTISSIKSFWFIVFNLVNDLTNKTLNYILTQTQLLLKTTNII